jgi:hypothetical protein
MHRTRERRKEKKTRRKERGFDIMFSLMMY